MDLTEEQWVLIQPLIPPPSPYVRGRPPANSRAVLNGIFRKFILGAPWYDLPDCATDRYPSWQTCYRRYRRWQSSGLMDEIYHLLYQDLRDRAGIDLFQDLIIQGVVNRDLDPACNKSAIILSWIDDVRQLHLPPELQDTWQGATLHLLVQIILAYIKQKCVLISPRTLTIKSSR
jgi:transposase